MARPRTYLEPRKATAVRLPVPLHDRLRTEAMVRGVSANHLVERAIVALLDGPPPGDSADQQPG